MSDPTSVKRKRSNEDGLLCPISLALPLDPVTAEDGQIYEREAIEDYIESKHGAELVSPKTREKMGKRLFPSPLIKTHIKDLIENGVITGEPAEDWKKRCQQKKEMADLLKEAENGDVAAMEKVAKAHDHALDGFKRDYKLAFKWYEKARCAGSILAMAKVGEALVGGFGATKNVTKGVMYLGMAEGRGSDFASLLLGLYMAEGKHGLLVDKLEARYLIEKSLSESSEYKHMGEKNKEEAKAKLAELLQKRSNFKLVLSRKGHLPFR